MSTEQVPCTLTRPTKGKHSICKPTQHTDPFCNNKLEVICRLKKVRYKLRRCSRSFALLHAVAASTVPDYHFFPEFPIFPPLFKPDIPVRNPINFHFFFLHVRYTILYIALDLLLHKKKIQRSSPAIKLSAVLSV